MNPIHLRHDPANGAAPNVLARRNPVTAVDFRTQPGRCPRCNTGHNLHVWQLVDPDETEQQGVIDCGTVVEVAA